MIPFVIKRKKYYLPTSFGEIPLNKILSIPSFAEDPDGLVSFLMDCPHRVDATNLIPFLQWMNEPVDLSEYASEPGSVPDIKMEEWGKKIQAQTFIAMNLPVDTMAQTVALYLTERTAEEWATLTLPELCPIYLNIAEQMDAILEQEQMLKTNVTPQQIEAGIEEFAQLGHMNTIDMIAGGDVLKYEAVLKIDYNTIFAKLLKTHISNKFTTEYKRIISRDKSSTK